MVLAYLYFWMARPVGKGPAGPAVAQAAFAQPWSERRVLLLGIGDSITAGLGARSPDHSYFQRLAKNPPDEFTDLRGVCLSVVFPNLESSNLAISGSTSLDHLRVIEENLPPQPADLFGLIVITTGGNDLIHSYGQRPPREGAMYGATLAEAQPWIANFEQRLNKMLDLLDERFPGGCQVFLADIYDPTDGVGDAPSVYLPHWPDGLAIHAAYNEIIHRVAKDRQNVQTVPLHEAFLGHGAHCRQFWRSTYRAEDPHYWFYDNIEDPNDRGYDAIRRVFLNTIAAAADDLNARATLQPNASVAPPP
ncbi:MAG TPA: SGNH/GDSL hydrolase family protein [Pirellulales bacterium]|jgi:lysophospholipase L1-like esterase